MSQLRILIADDHPLVRKGLRAALAPVPQFEVLGEAATGEEVIELAARLEPDVVLMDIQMPNVNGITATRRLLETNPGIRILVVTLFDDDESVFLALRAGARGYILKEADEEELIRAIEAVGRGEAIFSPAIATRVLAYFAAPRFQSESLAFPSLTDREREILGLIAQGQSNQAIATRLGLRTKTVANYVSSIFAKLQVADRAEAIIRARDAGLGR